MKLFLSLLFLCGCSLEAGAATYNYSTTASSGTPDLWSAGTNWSGVPVSGTGTSLVFTVTSTTGITPASQDDLAGNFLLNSLTLAGQGVATSGATTTMTITGNALEFASSGGTTPTLVLSGRTSGVGTFNYNVANNLVLDNNLAISGTGSAAFTFTGALSGTGSITKTGSSSVSISSGTQNNNYSWTGGIDDEAGTVKIGGTLYTTGALTVATGATLSGGTLAVSSLAGGNSTSTLSATNLYVDYVGSGTDVFAGTVTSAATITALGNGNLTLSGPLGGGVRLAQNGSGILTLSALSNLSIVSASYTALPSLNTSMGTVKFTGTSGVVGGANGAATVLGGTYWFDPDNVGTAVAVSSIASTTSTTQVLTYGGATTIKLDRDGNTSLAVAFGRTDSTNTAAMFSRGVGNGTIMVAPTDGLASLGGTERLIVLGTSTALPTVANGMVAASIIGVNNDANQSGDFLTYTGTGVASDTGFQEIQSGNYLTGFTSSTSTNAVELIGNGTTTLSGSASAYALRADGVVNIGAGNTLTLGNYASSFQEGLILNGADIEGGTLASAAGTSAELVVYVSAANATIDSVISNSGHTATGGSNAAAALTKYGPGTLFIKQQATYVGNTVITEGALDVGTVTATGTTASGALPSLSEIYLLGGVLEGNGTLNKNLGTQASTSGITFYQSSGNLGPGGGFAANGGLFTVTLNSGSTLVWGSTTTAASTFMPENSATKAQILMFGATTANNQVILTNTIDLGQHTSSSGLTSDSTNYYRDIYVTQGTGGDSAKITGAISSTDPHGIYKDGTGTLILAGNNTYAGATVVGAGRLMITGATSGQGAYTVNSGAVLGGAGGTIGTLNANVTLQGGASLSVSNGGIAVAGTTAMTPGTMTLSLGTGTLDLSQAVTGTSQALTFVLTTVGASDSVVLAGSSQLNIGTGLSLGDFNLIAGTGFGAGTYILFDTGAAGTLLGSLGTNLTGTIDGLSSTLALSTDGNGFQDVVLVVAVPEPATWALLLAGAAVLFGFRRRLRVA